MGTVDTRCRAGLCAGLPAHSTEADAGAKADSPAALHGLSDHDDLVRQHPVVRRASRVQFATSRGRFGTGRLGDRKSTRLNSSHTVISYAVFCLKKKKNKTASRTQ